MDKASLTEKPTLTMAQQIAQAASAYEQQRTGLAPRSVTVPLPRRRSSSRCSGLCPRPRRPFPTPGGQCELQEFHRQLFAGSSESHGEEIKRITGSTRESTAEVETATGTSAGLHQRAPWCRVFLLDHSGPHEDLSSNGHLESKLGAQAANHPCRGRETEAVKQTSVLWCGIVWKTISPWPTSKRCRG